MGLDLSNVVKDDSLSALLHYNIGSAYIDKLNFDSAKIHLNEALQFAQKIGNEEIEISVYSSFGRLFTKMGNNLTSIEYHEEVIRLAEKKGYYNKMAIALLNIAIKHYNDENDEQAEKYLHRALEVYQTKVENPENYVFSHIYSIFSKVYRTTKRYDQALEAAQKTLEFAQLAKSKHYELEALSELSNIYAHYYQEYDKALALANQALSLAEETGNSFSIKTCLHTIGNIYFSAEDYEKGKMYVLRALEMTNPDDLIGMKLSTRLLIYNLIHLRETDEALSAFEKFDSLSTALYQENSQTALSEHEVRYETEKKQLEIERQQEVIARQNMQRWMLAAGIAVCMLFLALLWYLLHLRTRHNHTLTERNDALAEMNATKDKFFSIISHDLKNPAVAQRDAIQLLVKNDRVWDANTLTDYYAGLLNSADGQVELLYNLLNWAKIQTGRMAYTPASFALVPQLRSDLSLIRNMAEKKDITFDVAIPDNALVTGDPNMIITVLRNLLTNAVKFTASGGTVALEIISRGDAAGACTGTSRYAPTTFTVTDTGTGMSAAQINNLFNLDSAHSGRGTAGEQGSGLGLIVCKELLEKHGSILHIESEEGKGSRFWFVV